MPKKASLTGRLRWCKACLVDMIETPQQDRGKLMRLLLQRSLADDTLESFPIAFDGALLPAMYCRFQWKQIFSETNSMRKQ